MKKKIIRITTVPTSLGSLLHGQLKYMNQYFEIIGVSSYGDGKLDDVALSEGIRTKAVEMSRSITPFKDLSSAWQLYKLFRKEKPFIVHTHTPKAGTLGMLAAYLARVPHRLHTVAGLPLLEAKGMKRRILNQVEKITYACATKVYPNSEGLKKIIEIDKFTSKDKLKVLAQGSSNGIATKHFNPELYSYKDRLLLKEKLGLQENDFIFLFVGRLVKDKGVNELVSSFSKIADGRSDLKLLLVGEYETYLDPLLPSTLSEIKSNSNILFVGWQKDVRPYFAISNVFVFPSYREGFPNVVLQAGAMGLPCIVTDINGCNEIILDGENGVIIPPKDTDALQVQMLNFVSNHSLFKDKIYCRKLIKDRFEQKIIWKAILEEYNRLNLFK